MLSFTQCNIARTMTQTTTSDVEINKEFNSVIPSVKKSIFIEIDKLIKQHDMPIDNGLGIMMNDFLTISQKYSISPATSFCIYMDYKQQNI